MSNKLSDIVNFNPSLLLKKGTVAPFIEMASLPTNTKFIKQIDEKPFSGGSKFKNGDTLFARITPCLENGKTGKVTNLKDEIIGHGSTEFIVMSAKEPEFDEDYIYYFARLPEFREFAQQRMVGTSGRQRVAWQDLADFEFIFPPKEQRKKAAALLNIYDQKIDLNTQINQTLEEIAQALFKSWFVDFDPVRAKVQALSDGMSLEQAELAAMQAISGKKTEELTALSQTQPDRYAELAETAKAFPCEMVEVDGVEVPKGWEVKRIDEIANIIKGKSYKSSELEKSKTALVTLKSFNRGGGYRLDGLKEYTGKYKPEQEVFAGELIIAYTDVTQAADVIGKPAMVMSDSNYQHLVISLDVGVVRPFNDVYKHFLYCLAMTESFQAHTKSFCTGTTVLHLGKDAVPSFEFINPSNELLHVFYKQTSPIFEKINLQIEENKNLDKVRDLLLPRLLNGEIK